MITGARLLHVSEAPDLGLFLDVALVCSRAAAGPRMLTTEAVEMQTATAAPRLRWPLSKLSSWLGFTRQVFLPSLLGDGVYGLLGMSFLSRFTAVTGDREIQLKAKALEQ